MSDIKVDFKAVQHIAKLSRLAINEQQAQEYTNQLNQILGLFDKISNLSTEGIEPLVTPTEIEIFWREDIAENNYSSEEMVANAPSQQGSLFKVPPVV